MCCACDGSCNHIGPHSYCVAHSPSLTAAPMYYPYAPTFTTGATFTVDDARVVALEARVKRLEARLEQLDAAYYQANKDNPGEWEEGSS